MTVTYISTRFSTETSTTLSTRRNGQIHITWKTKMAAAAILNFGKMLITLDWMKTSRPNFMRNASRPYGDDQWPEVETGSWFSWRHQMNVWGISMLISVTITDIWTIFDVELKHYTTNMTECAKFTWLENPRWRRPPSGISENVNNSEMDRAMHKIWWADASRQCGYDTWPKVGTGSLFGWRH